MLKPRPVEPFFKITFLGSLKIEINEVIEICQQLHSPPEKYHIDPYYKDKCMFLTYRSKFFPSRVDLILEGQTHPGKSHKFCPMQQDLSAYRIALLTAPCPSHKNFNVRL